MQFSYRRYVLGILFLLFASAFISTPPLFQSKTEQLHESPELVEQNKMEFFSTIDSVLSPYNQSNFERAVLEETARILGLQYMTIDNGSLKIYYRLGTTEEIKYEDRGKVGDNYFYISIQIDEYDGSAWTRETTFHNYPAHIGPILQQWEIGMSWEMEGYTFSIYTANGTHSGTPDPIPYGEALYEAFWNVTNGTTGGSTVPPAPQDIPSEPENLPENLPADLCAGVNCMDNYCKEDGTKFLYNCACSAEDGKCYCEGMVCEEGCDDALGGCIQQQAGDPNDICNGVDCGPDYCLDDQKTRMYNCKCAADDGECYCYNEVCETGCNMATGKCLESMVIQDNDYSNYPDDSGGLLGVLGVIGGVAAGGGVVVGGGYLALKGIQGVLARRAISTGTKAAAEAAEPTLRELLARAEQSADRASRAIDQALKSTELDKQRYRDMLGRTTQQNEEWARTMDRRAEAIEDAEWYVKGVKKGADIGAELVGNVPGVGTAYKYGYNLTTTAIESAAGGDSLGEVVLKTVSKGAETATGDLLFGKVTQLENLAKDTVHKTVIKVIKDTGADKVVMEEAKNEGLNNFMNIVKEVKSRSSFGKIEKRVEGVAKRIDRKAVGRMVKRVLYSK